MSRVVRPRCVHPSLAWSGSGCRSQQMMPAVRVTVGGQVGCQFDAAGYRVSFEDFAVKQTRALLGLAATRSCRCCRVWSRRPVQPRAPAERMPEEPSKATRAGQRLARCMLLLVRPIEQDRKITTSRLSPQNRVARSTPNRRPLVESRLPSDTDRFDLPVSAIGREVLENNARPSNNSTPRARRSADPDGGNQQRREGADTARRILRHGPDFATAGSGLAAAL